jgi:hypothetical protein
MTWVIGASSIFGAGVLISDVCVTFAHGERRDILQKAYPLGPDIAGGFSGSVLIGFRLLTNLSHSLNTPPVPEGMCWDPITVAKQWSPHARSIFQRAPYADRKLGASLLLVGVSPHHESATLGGSRAYIIRMKSPDFDPGVRAGPLAVVHIGSGSRIVELKRVVRRTVRWESSMIQAEVGGLGAWSSALSRSLGHVLERRPSPGVSAHLNFVHCQNGQFLEGNNDYVTRDDEGRIQEFTMPSLAKGYAQFQAMSEAAALDGQAALA